MYTVRPPLTKLIRQWSHFTNGCLRCRMHYGYGKSVVLRLKKKMLQWGMHPYKHTSLSNVLIPLEKCAKVSDLLHTTIKTHTKGIPRVCEFLAATGGEVWDCSRKVNEGTNVRELHPLPTVGVDAHPPRAKNSLAAYAAASSINVFIQTQQKSYCCKRYFAIECWLH